MNEPLAALVAAAKALDRAYGAIPAGGLSPLTPERALAWADLQDALAAIPPDAVLVRASQLEILRRAHKIGSVSHDGDGWFAADAGYGYDEAEATMRQAGEILHRLAPEP